ncbi:MFS transporter [Heyndrickxia ginsengihumi]|uniref:MFS transporter n=1 Tax=Heyndrickxia ginsengihumi TaxID=363870 RepID=UPI003D1E3977
MKSNWKLFLSLPVLSWALYDFANTIFSSNVNTIFFPLFLADKIGGNQEMNQISSTFISYANAAASIFLVFFSPLFGASIDRTGKKKIWIIIFTFICVVATFLMGVFTAFTLPGNLLHLPTSLIFVILAFVVAKFFYQSSLIFYDAMLADIVEKTQVPLVSGFGVATGYMGTLLGLSIYPFVHHQYGIAFIATAVLFFLFSLPICLFTKDGKPHLNQTKTRFFSGYFDIWLTFKEMQKFKSIFIFMISYFFLNDAIATAIAMMAVYAKTIVHFSNSTFILLYFISTISSIVGSFLFGYITKAKGGKRSVLFVAMIMVCALVCACIATSQTLMWIAGSLFGVSLGAMWVASRSLIIDLSPEQKRGQFFGLFAFSGKVSAVFGPLLYGSITWGFASFGNVASRFALGSLVILTIIGTIVLLYVRDADHIKSEKFSNFS